MKKITVIFIAAVFVFLFGGCTASSEIENKKIVTACSAEAALSGKIYKFYVSVPSGEDGGEDGSFVSSAKIYEFKSKNFEKAVEQFKSDGGGEIDLDHVGLFISDKNYLESCFEDDEPYIRRQIKMNPMVNFCIDLSGGNEIFDCISTEYDGNTENFTSFMFEKSNSDVSCSISDIALAVYNKYYTAVIPVIKTVDMDKGSLANICAVSFYNTGDNVKIIDGDDCENFRTLISENGKKLISRFVFLKNGRLHLAIPDDFKGRDDFLSLAKKNFAENYDIFNCMYYSKRLFITSSDYFKFMNENSLSDVIFN